MVILDKKTGKIRAKIFYQSVFDKWPLKDNSVQAIITSPPYWRLRNYNVSNVIIGGDKDCDHKFIEHYERPREEKRPPDRLPRIAVNKLMSQRFSQSIKSSFCFLCGAWEGQYGLELSYKDYIEHTLLWCEEAWRVLKNDGVFFLNIGDTYGTVSGSMGTGKWFDPKRSKEENDSMPKKLNTKLHKCKLLIPERIAIDLIEKGWILRNYIVWQTNKTPESCKDRFSRRWESVFMFVKKPKYYFNLDAVKIESITYKYDKRCHSEHGKIIYNGKSIKTSTFIRSKPFVNPGDIWHINTQPLKYQHYAAWPEKLAERMILCSSKENDVVLDPFCGSGRTLKVALNLNRKALGIDLGYNGVQQKVLEEFI